MRVTGQRWQDLLEGLPESRQGDARALVALMGTETGEPPEVWASRIIGFGRYQFSRQGFAPLAAFAPTPRHMTVYLSGDFQERYPRLLAELGPVRHGKSCLYLPDLTDLDNRALTMLIRRTIRVHRGQTTDR